jgi:hypothetical protein
MAKVRFIGCWSAKYNFGKADGRIASGLRKPSGRLMAHMSSTNPSARFLREADEATG